MTSTDGPMRTLIYKRTHSGDPDPKTGVFGNNDCMGRNRGWDFGAVIGIGGMGPEPERKGIAGKLTWIGIGSHKIGEPNRSRRGPLLTFDHFWYRGDQGPLLEKNSPLMQQLKQFENPLRLCFYGRFGRQ